jgi:serine/threonine protein kinase
VQYLVYEHVANGSLDQFFRTSEKRALLTASIRLSIMFELIRAVHFLHNYTGHGCDGHVLFHRDIKSANIGLAKDYTIRLIDCGLSKLVPVTNKTPRTWSVVNCDSTDISVFGTPRYRCPEYETNWNVRPYSYTAACDVYAIGVVLVELITGSLTSDQSSRVGTQGFDVFRGCSSDTEGNDIHNGWQQLKAQKDHCIEWTPACLDIICDAAIRCLNPRTVDRITTTKLLRMLSEAICLNAGIQLRNPSNPDSKFAQCVICFLTMPSRKCNKGHEVCATCIENKILCGLTSGSEVGPAVCPFAGCSSDNEYLYGYISAHVFEFYTHLPRPSNVKQYVSAKNMMSTVSEVTLNTNAMVSLLVADHPGRRCPHIVLITPVQDPKQWSTITQHAYQNFQVVFYCARSKLPGHEPFQIQVPVQWILKIAPWLQVCLEALKPFINSNGLPLPTFSSEQIRRFDRMRLLLEFLKNEPSSDEQRPVLLEGDLLDSIADMTVGCGTWESDMVAVYENGAIIWVRKEQPRVLV